MSTFSVSIVIPVWNQWQFTNACLESLRPTLGVRDEVIVVDNGSEDQTAKGLTSFPWVKVITNETNRGFAAACNQGAAAATNEIVIFLNNDTLLPGHWIDGLVWPFEDEAVVATGPRSNFVSGPQLVENPTYSVGSMSELRRFAKQWRHEHKGETGETPRLVGFCLAVRKSTFDLVGGFDETFEIGGAEDDDLGIRLLQHGRMLICHESFVHHHGHATFDGNGLDWFAVQQGNVKRFQAKHYLAATPISDCLLSACMIVKDEAEMLPRCLDSLTGLVDEVVIYDTGSTDGSIELARRAGATVIEGYWDDDFGRARTAALEHCRGDWVLHIDADEVWEGDARETRKVLSGTSVPAYGVEILNLSGTDKNNLTHRPTRLFRRAQFHWVGRLHEQVVRHDGGTWAPVTIDGCRIVHHGYLPEVVKKKNKAERNLRIAQIDADTDETRDPVDRLTNLGRSYFLAGRNEEALALFLQARDLESDSPVVSRMLCRAATQTCLALHRDEDAIAWADDLAATSEHADTSRYFKTIAYARLERWQEAVDASEGLHDMRDDDGVVFPQYMVDMHRAIALAGLGRWDDAATTITPVAQEQGHDEQIWALVAESYWRTGRDAGPLVAAVTEQHRASVLAQLPQAHPEAADAVLERLYADEAERPRALAIAIRIAPKLPVERALEWSNRLRSFNLQEHCPLVAVAYDTTRDDLDRLRAAAVAHVAFGDQRPLGAVKLIATATDPKRFAAELQELNALAPVLLEQFILAAASNASRAFEMARALFGLGAADEAIAVLQHGMRSTDARSIVDDAAQWLDSVGRAEEASAVRAAHA